MNNNIELKTKNDFRKTMKSLRNTLDMPKISEQICSNIVICDFWEKAKNVLIFFPMKNEVDLRALINDSNKKFYLPRVEDLSLVIHEYKEESLIKSKMGVFEPSSSQKAIDPQNIDIVFIPALSMNNQGYRLGYGAGFYDRFIPNLNKLCLTVGVIPNELLSNDFPFDSWDVPVSKIITQTGLLN